MKPKEPKNSIEQLESDLLEDVNLLDSETGIYPTENCACDSICAPACSICGEVDNLGKLIVYAVPHVASRLPAIAVTAPA